MKALMNFENKDKLRLLHDLFPMEIPDLLTDILDFCADFRENRDAYAENWNNGFMPIDYWFSLSVETEKLIKKYRLDMQRSSRVFSDQLSFTYAILFVNDRIIKYADSVSGNDKFKQAVRLLYHVETENQAPLKQMEELRKQLLDFEQDITRSIGFQLKRIGRTVKMDEFDFIPFNEDVSFYIDAIRLDKEQEPICDTSFSEMEQKYLCSFISDNEIDHWNMIALLGLLMDIPDGGDSPT